MGGRGRQTFTGARATQRTTGNVEPKQLIQSNSERFMLLVLISCLTPLTIPRSRRGARYGSGPRRGPAGTTPAWRCKHGSGHGRSTDSPLHHEARVVLLLLQLALLLEHLAARPLRHGQPLLEDADFAFQCFFSVCPSAEWEI